MKSRDRGPREKTPKSSSPREVQTAAPSKNRESAPVNPDLAAGRAPRAVRTCPTRHAVDFLVQPSARSREIADRFGPIGAGRRCLESSLSHSQLPGSF